MRVDSCKKGKRIVPVTPNKCGEFFLSGRHLLFLLTQIIYFIYLPIYFL